MKVSKVEIINKLKLMSVFAVLALALVSVGCGSEQPTCQICGFNSREQVQDVGVGGGLYAADTEGCVLIVNSGNGNCGRFVLQPLSGSQS